MAALPSDLATAFLVGYHNAHVIPEAYSMVSVEEESSWRGTEEDDWAENEQNSPFSSTLQTELQQHPLVECVRWDDGR